MLASSSMQVLYTILLYLMSLYEELTVITSEEPSRVLLSRPGQLEVIL